MTQYEKQIWNEAVRQTLKEVWLYDGLIPSETERKELCLNVQKKISYKNPKPKQLRFQQP